MKYSLSHLMLVFVIVGLICGWYLDHKTLSDKYNHDSATLSSVVQSSKVSNQRVIKSLTYTDLYKSFERADIPNLDKVITNCIRTMNNAAYDLTTQLELLNKAEVK